jgi:hypothetical protein
VVVEAVTPAELRALALAPDLARLCDAWAKALAEIHNQSNDASVRRMADRAVAKLAELEAPK